MDISTLSDDELLKAAGVMPKAAQDAAIVDIFEPAGAQALNDDELLAMIGGAPISQNAEQPENPSFLGQMRLNLDHGLQSGKDLLSGNWQDIGATKPTPKTQGLADKLFPQGYDGSFMGAVRNLGNTRPSDFSGALLEKFGETPEGKILSFLGGVNPVWNAAGTAIDRYVNPAIEKATGIAPDNLHLLELAASPLGLRARNTKDPTVSAIAALAKSDSLRSLLADTSSGSRRTKANPIQERARSIVTEALQADEISPQSVVTRLANAKKTGAPAVALDVAERNIGGVPVAGRNLQSLASAAANMPGKGAAIAGQVATRKMSQAKRVGEYLDESLGKKGYYDIADDVIAQIDSKANASREKALAYPNNIRSKEVNELLKRPAGQKALAFAKTMALDAGVDLGKADATGMLRNMNTRTLDWTKRALDQMINSTEGKNQITGRMTEQGKIWVEIKNKISNTIKEQNPDYKQWMEKYGEEASRKNALDAGRAFLTDDPEIVGRQFSKFTDPEKQAYLVGVKRSLLDKIENAGDNADAVKRVWNEGTRKRLGQIMPTKDLRELTKRMEIERRMAATDQRSLGNSATMQRQEYANKIKTDSPNLRALKTVVNPRAAVTDLALDGLTKSLKRKVNKMNSETAAEVMRILYSGSGKEMMQIQNLAQKRGLSQSQILNAVETIPSPITGGAISAIQEPLKITITKDKNNVR